MRISEGLSPSVIYFESLKNLLAFNLGTSTASGLPVVREVAGAFLESSKIIIPSLLISLLVGILLLPRIRKSQGNRSYLDWICFVPMVVFSYLSLFLVDKLGFDVTSNVRYVLAVIILSIYPAYLIYNSFSKRYKEIIVSDFYKYHQANGFPAELILIKYLPRYFIIEYLSIFESLFIYMFGFIFFVESPLAINGIGRSFVWSIQRYDYPMIIGFCVFAVIILTAINVIMDILLLKIDKRR